MRESKARMALKTLFFWNIGKRSGLPHGTALIIIPFGRAFPFLDTFRQQVFDLAVDGAEIILRPLGQFLPQGGRHPQQKLLFFLLLVFQRASPSLPAFISSF